MQLHLIDQYPYWFHDATVTLEVRTGGASNWLLDATLLQ
jgi:hypothetical protein